MPTSKITLVLVHGAWRSVRVVEVILLLQKQGCGWSARLFRLTSLSDMLARLIEYWPGLGATLSLSDMRTPVQSSAPRKMSA